MAGKPGREVPRMIEALRQGQEPSAVGARSVETLKLSSIGRAEVTPEQYTVKFIADGDNGATLEYSSSETNGAEIARTVLARTGRTYREEKQDIGPVEAVMPPIVMGVVIGIFWALLYGSAGQVEAGEQVQIRPGRHSGMKRLFVTLASMLGVNGTIGLGVVLALLIVGWATMRLVRRPQRTVWLPE
jgi:hypothetical protein